MQPYLGQLVASGEGRVLYRIHSKMKDGRFMVVGIFPLAQSGIRQYLREEELLAPSLTLIEIMVNDIHDLASRNKQLDADNDRLKILMHQQLESACMS